MAAFFFSPFVIFAGHLRQVGCGLLARQVLLYFKSQIAAAQNRRWRFTLRLARGASFATL
jgi:hypothetical protein